MKVILEERPAAAQPFQMPSHCPVCGTPLVRPPGEAVTRCPNPDCIGALRRGILHFAGKTAMDIDGLGENHRPAHRPGAGKGDSRPVPLKRSRPDAPGRFAEKSAGNLVAAIEGSKTVPLARLVYALGHPRREDGPVPPGTSTAWRTWRRPPRRSSSTWRAWGPRWPGADIRDIYRTTPQPGNSGETAGAGG